MRSDRRDAWVERDPTTGVYRVLPERDVAARDDEPTLPSARAPELDELERLPVVAWFASIAALLLLD